MLAFRGTAGRLQGKAYVDGKLACEAVVTCRLLSRAAGAKGDAAEGPGPDTPVKLSPAAPA